MAKKIIWAVMLAIVVIGAAIAIRSVSKKNEVVKYDQNYIWCVEYAAGAEQASLVRGPKIAEIRQDINKLIAALNKFVVRSEVTRPQDSTAVIEFPTITLQRVEQQTARIEIANDQYLTQKMGSSGAQDYLAEVTYTLTEAPGVKSVDFVFAPGEHAMPGVYSRESFTAYMVVSNPGSKR